MFHFFPIQEAECIYWQGLAGLCTKNTSWALIERPYSCAPQAVGAVYDRPGFLCKAVRRGVAALQFVHIRHFLFKTSTRRKAEKSKVLTVLRRYTRCRSE